MKANSFLMQAWNIHAPRSTGVCVNREYSFCCINHASRAMLLNFDDRGKHLLKTCSIHAHYKFKYFFTASLDNTYSLHCSTAAPWLHHENKKWCQTVKPYHIAKRCRPLNASDKIVPYKVVNFKQLFKNAESCHIQANIGSNQNCYASLNTITVVKCKIIWKAKKNKSPFWHCKRRQCFLENTWLLAFSFVNSESNSWVQSNTEAGGPAKKKQLLRDCIKLTWRQ